MDLRAPKGGSQRLPGAICQGGALRGALVLKVNVQGVYRQAARSGGIQNFYCWGLVPLVGFMPAQWQLTEAPGSICQGSTLTHSEGPWC